MPFEKGNKLGRGRPKGSRSKLTTLRESYVGAFMKTGGVKALVKWIEASPKNRSQFYHDLLRLIPNSNTELAGKPGELSITALKQSLAEYHESNKLTIQVIRTVTDKLPDNATRSPKNAEVIDIKGKEPKASLPPARKVEDLSLKELEDGIKDLEAKKKELVKARKLKINR